MADPKRQKPSSEDDLRRRLDLLERANARLNRRLEATFGADNPCFDPMAFQKALAYYKRWMAAPLLLFMPLILLSQWSGPSLPTTMIGPLPLIDLGGAGSSHPGMGIGIIAAGGAGFGVVAFGGLAAGIFAFGGGAIGIVAVGGGAIGVIAFGGGAAGVVALGGGAVGRYVLADDGIGKYVFTRKRQDPEAVAFFVRYLPRLRSAITTPLPVIPVSPTDAVTGSGERPEADRTEGGGDDDSAGWRLT